ncbi:MAG: hypothetical protein MJ068_04135 [Clostridia bacterium]|nr:hypothetical protein [Clostridia bacterium]
MQLEKQHVLTKKEKAVMKVVYDETDMQTGACLLTPISIFEKIPLDIDIEEDELDVALRNLEIDDYFDVTKSDKKGELVYCINMHKKGLQFARVERAFKKNITFRLLLACGTGAVGAIVGVIIKYVIMPLITQGHI